MFSLLEFSVFGLLLYWGLISLSATTRRDGIHFSASDVMGSISDSLYYFFIFFFIFFFWLRIRGLAVSELPVIYWAHHGLGLPWAWLCYNFFFFA